MNYRTGSMREKQMNTGKIPLTHNVDKPHRDKKFGVFRSSFAVLFTLIFGICAGQLRAADSADPKKWVADNLGSLVELYRHLHQTPELSEKEKVTSARMAKELRDVGIKVTTHVG